jgi:hypothetical protein
VFLPLGAALVLISFIRWAPRDNAPPEECTAWLEDARFVHVLAWRFAKVSNNADDRNIFAADYV